MEVASDLELSLSSTMRTETPQQITTPKKVGLTPIPTERLRPHVVPSEGSQSSPESQRGEYGPRTGVVSEAAQQIYDLANVSDMISVLRSEKTRLEARVAELTSEVNAQKLQLESAAYTKASMEGEFENKLKLLQAQTVAEADLQKIALSKLTEELRVKDQLLVSMRTERSEALGSEQAELLRLRSERASENDVLRTKEDALRALEARARGAEEELARVRAEARERHDELAARRAAAEDAAAAGRQRAAEAEARAEALCAEQETGAAERKALSGELARLQAALASQAAAAEAAAGEKEALQAEVAGLTKQISVLQAEGHTWQALQESFLAAKGGLEAANTQLAAAEARASQLESDRAEAQAERDSLNKALNVQLKLHEQELAAARAAHGAEQAAARVDAEALGAQLKEAQLEAKVAAGEAAKAEELAREMEKLRTENERLNRKVQEIFEPAFSGGGAAPGVDGAPSDGEPLHSHGLSSSGGAADMSCAKAPARPPAGAPARPPPARRARLARLFRGATAALVAECHVSDRDHLARLSHLQDKNEMLQRLSGLHETLDRLKYEGIVSGGESLAEAGSSFAPYSPSSPSGGADGFLPRGGAGAERWAPPPPIMNPDVTIYSAALQQPRRDTWSSYYLRDGAPRSAPPRGRAAGTPPRSGRFLDDGGAPRTDPRADALPDTPGLAILSDGRPRPAAAVEGGGKGARARLAFGDSEPPAPAPAWQAGASSAGGGEPADGPRSEGVALPPSHQPTPQERRA